jgi:phage-related protein (TIGR01555 family)
MDETPEIQNDVQFANSISALAGLVNAAATGAGYPQSQLSQTATQFINLRWYLISNFRQLLSQMYVEHGIVQTLVDQPVDDAFSTGFEIKSGELDGEDIEKLMVYVERNRVIQTLMQGLKWARLYGGAAIIIITDEDPATPLDISKINEKTPLMFKSADMWELYNAQMNISDQAQIVDGDVDKLNKIQEFYDFYGKKIHKSRVYRLFGKKAPSFIRPRLRGWGMSEIERLVRSINQYMKNQDVVFELLDEAKVDVFKMKGLNVAMMNSAGTNKVAERIQAANMIKNYNNALTMDMDDDYQQKQIAFTGLSEVLTQIRQGLAADLKMPMTKLFGISSAGFNSGEDDIENYNSMIEGEIRSKCKFIVVDLLQICCQKVFGFAPEDLMIRFHSLRVMSAKYEEAIKDSQFNRTMAAYTSGLMDGIEAKNAFNKGSLLPIEIDATTEPAAPINGDFTTNKSETV